MPQHPMPHTPHPAPHPPAHTGGGEGGAGLDHTRVTRHGLGRDAYGSGIA